MAWLFTAGNGAQGLPVLPLSSLWFYRCWTEHPLYLCSFSGWHFPEYAAASCIFRPWSFFFLSFFLFLFLPACGSGSVYLEVVFFYRTDFIQIFVHGFVAFFNFLFALYPYGQRDWEACHNNGKHSQDKTGPPQDMASNRIEHFRRNDICDEYCKAVYHDQKPRCP